MRHSTRENGHERVRLTVQAPETGRATMSILEIRERLRQADPTTKASHRWIGLLFSILQWIAFAATIQVIGSKVHEPLLSALGYALYLIVVIHTVRITWVVVGTVSAALKFRSVPAHMAARFMFLAISLAVSAAIVRAFRSAASEMILFYSKN